MEFCDRLKLMLELKSITASELARRAHVSKQILSKWLSGQKPKDINKIKLVADVLETTIDYLVFGTNSNTPSINLEHIVESGKSLRGLFEIEIKLIKRESD